MNWGLLMGDSDIVTSLNTFYSIVNKFIDENVPNQKSSLSTYPEWYTSELKKLICDKKEMHAKWKEQKELRAHNNGQIFSNHLELFYRLEFQHLRSKCIRLSRELYARYIEDVENRIPRHVKSFWSFVNKAKKSNSLPNVMYLRDRSASCRRSICNLLADQF